MSSLTTSGRQLSLVARMAVSVLVVGTVALSIMLVGAFVTGFFVTLLGFVVLTVVETGGEFVTGNQEFLGHLIERYSSNGLYLTFGMGVLLAPFVYLKPVKRELQTFKQELGTDGSVAESRDPKRAAMVRRLAKQANITEPTMRIVNRRRPESYALGDESGGTIIVTRGLIRQLDDDELEAVLAHEVSHLANGDGRLMTALLIPLLVAEDIGSDSPPSFELYARVGILYFGLVPYFVHLIAWVLVYTVTTIQTGICKLGLAVFSRERELAADRAATELTGSPTALASALQTLSDARSRPNQDKREFTRSAGALDILPVGEKSRLDWLFRTHPDVKTRLSQLEDIAEKRTV